MDGSLEIDPNYRNDFIKLLFRYKEDISLLDPLSFSNTIFLIEQKYFRNSGSKKEFNCDRMILETNELCFAFYKNLKSRPGGKYFFINDNSGTPDKPGILVKDFKKMISMHGKEIFTRKAGTENIDLRKIAALYIRSILKYKLFGYETPAKDSNTCLYTQSPNEYFILVFLMTIFRAIHNDEYGELDMDPSYRDDFIKRLSYYKEDIDKRFNYVSFSEEIVFIEQNYFKPSRAP